MIATPSRYFSPVVAAVELDTFCFVGSDSKLAPDLAVLHLGERGFAGAVR